MRFSCITIPENMLYLLDKKEEIRSWHWQTNLNSLLVFEVKDDLQKFASPALKLVNANLFCDLFASILPFKLPCDSEKTA
jgi:hypothetical protein